MVETAAHLIDHVIPPVPVRQWVLSFPWPLRLLFANRPDVLSRCLAVIFRAIQTDLTQRAGLKVASGARTGAVTLIQRFGSALNLNVHLHMLVLDGVYTLEDNGIKFHCVNAPRPEELEKLLNRLIHRIVRRLTKDEVLVQDPEGPWLDFQQDDEFDAIKAASIQYRIAVGSDAGQRTLTLKNPAIAKPTAPKAFTVNRDGFSLNASVSCQPHQRQRLERLCRYITRPPVCLERLSINTVGQVVYSLKHPFDDGTTTIVFSPEDFIARLAALVPRPRTHLTRYHGVLAPNSPFRRAVVPGSGPTKRRSSRPKTSSQTCSRSKPTLHADTGADQPIAPLSWAERLKRVFGIDVTLCPFCGGKLRIIADVTDPDVIRRILDHVQQRAPPAPLSESNASDSIH
jgi:hypothetical protein|tara:strand:- start:2467 stop:3666 length:1200 start_codon:yes stop_codon:yes gene_type:complete